MVPSNVSADSISRLIAKPGGVHVPKSIDVMDATT